MSQVLDAWGMPLTPYITAGTKSPGYTVTLPTAAAHDRRWFSAKNGIEAAYQASQAYRDKWLPNSHRARVMRADADTQARRAKHGVVDRASSALGKPGIDIVTLGTGAHDGTNQHVRATAYDSQRQKTWTAHYAIAHYGLDTALRYGLRKRLRWERRFYGHYSRLSEADWHRFALYVYEQHKTRPVSLEELSHGGSLTIFQWGVQARIMIQKVSHSRSFNLRHYGSLHETRVAAILWLIEVERTHRLTPGVRRTAVTRANRTTGVLGVCRRSIRDGRNRALTVIYEASVVINGRRQPMQFRVGRAGEIDALQEQVAFMMAIACRQQYESDFDTGRAFDPGALARLEEEIRLSRCPSPRSRRYWQTRPSA